MWKKVCLIALAACAFGFAPVPCANAGTEMITDNSAPEQTYPYVRPRRVYYAPPPVSLVLYPGYAYYGWPYRIHAYQRSYGRRAYGHGHHHWR